MSNLPNSEKDSLNIFLTQLKTLLDNPIYKKPKQNLSISVVIQAKGDGTLETVLPAPDLNDKHQFNSFVMTFRQMTMPKEKVVNFEKICSIILKYCDREEIKNLVQFALKQWRDLFESKLAIGLIGYDMINENTTNKELLKLWMYGGKFHTDENKTRDWNSYPHFITNYLEMLIQERVFRSIGIMGNVGNAIIWWLYEPKFPEPTVPTAL